MMKRLVQKILAEFVEFVGAILLLVGIILTVEHFAPNPTMIAIGALVYLALVAGLFYGVSKYRERQSKRLPKES